MLTKRDIAIIEELIERKLEEKLEEKLEQKLEEKLEEKLRALRNEIFERIDAFLGLYKRVDEEQTLLYGRVSEHSDQLEDHETRISALEEHKSYPN
ncbi:MAG: hypothetical protein N3A54_05080 [Patescibacteria group bacterium]|nr:hypothetical protein [Patescibacteria group bacterium]